MINSGKYTHIQQILICCLIPFLLLFSSCTHEESGETISATNGILDLSHWSLETDGAINLDGEWEFYWGKLLFPEDFKGGKLSDERRFFNVPGVWNDYSLDGESLPEDGYATFRLVIEHNSPKGIYAVKLPTISSAYQLWVNGEHAASIGKIGQNREEMQPNWSTHVTQFHLDQPTIELILQVSNFHIEKGGPWNKIRLGTDAQIRKEREFAVGYDLFLFGTILIISLYHFIIYLLRKHDRAPLYLSTFCFLIAIRISLIGEKFLLSVIPELDWVWALRLDFLTFYLGLPIFFMLIHSLFPEESSVYLKRSAQLCGVLASLFVLFSDPKLFTLTLIPFQVLTALFTFYILGVVIRGAVNKRGGAIWLLLGTIALLMTVLNDIFLANQFFYASELAPIGLYIFVFIQSAILSARFSRSFMLSEHLSNELESKNRELSDLSQLKDDFLSRTSHELRTPLNGIVGLAQAMLSGINGPLPDKVTEDLSLIENCGLRLTNLVNDILDFTELKYRELKLRIEPVDIYQLTDLVVKLLEPQTRFINLTIKNEVSQDLPFINGDENRLRQILNNLIGNAIKFTPSGFITISAEEKGGFVEVSVADTGIGIPLEKQEKIFDSFEQAGKSLIKEFGGTGLGLSISRQLVDLHGGAISVTSVPGEGADFRFTIPIAAQKSIDKIAEQCEGGIKPVEPIYSETSINQPLFDSEVQQINEGEASRFFKKEQVLSDLLILVVDDSPVNQKVMKANLKMAGARISVAGNGLECLEIMKTQTPDIIVLDVVMPKMSGYETAEKIRETYSREQLPIIFLSAKNRSDDLVKGFLAKGNDYLRKPFKLEELLLKLSLQAEIIKSRKRLQTSERKFAKLFYRAKEGIFQFSNERKLLNINPSGADIFGFESPEQMYDRAIGLDELLNLPQSFDESDPFLKERGYVELETEFLKRDGELFWGLMFLHRVEDVDGSQVCYEGVILDISERRQKEEEDKCRCIAEEAEGAKSCLLSNLNHELRSPLHTLLGYANLGISKSGTESSEKVEKYFDAIRQNGQKLLDLVNNLLELSKLEMGQTDYHFSQDKLSRLVQIAIDEFEDKADKKNIAVEFIPPEEPDDLKVDSEKMIQVIGNLISNSIKFTKPGGSIKIGIAPNARNLHFSISDDGLGIPDTELQQVFGKFEHGSNNGSEVNGAGLGLAICQRMILGHKGKIWAENNPTGGTIVKFQVPKLNIAPSQEET